MPSGLSRRKRLLFTSGAIVLAYALFEGACALFITFQYGGIQNLWNERGRIAQTETETADEQTDRDTALTFLGEKVRPDLIHPYSGFVRQPAPPESRVRTDHEVNEFGFNDSQPPIHYRTKNKVIIGIVGGSVAEQFATNACEALADELRSSPRYAGREFEFVRLALRGQKQPQQLMTVSYLLTLGAEFDMLINVDGFNEVALPIAENVPDHVAPSFPRKWHTRIANLRNPTVSKLVGQTSYLMQKRQERAGEFARAPRSFSPAATLVWKIQSDTQSAEIIALQTEVDKLAREETAYGATGPQMQFAGDEELQRHCVEIWSRASRLLQQLCAANGIAYYHFLQPNQYVEGTKPMAAAEKAVALKVENPYRAPAIACYPLLVAEGKNLSDGGVNFHDLTRVFADHDEPLYVDDCCHFSNAGDRILAHAIAAAILDDGNSK